MSVGHGPNPAFTITFALQKANSLTTELRDMGNAAECSQLNIFISWLLPIFFLIFHRYPLEIQITLPLQLHPYRSGRELTEAKNYYLERAF